MLGLGDPMHFRQKAILIILVLLVAGACAMVPVSAATTEIQIVKYANDNTTILNQTTVNYTWMQANLPVLGDGVTHYYSQGPTFNESDLWDNGEWQNVESRDWGAVKGTDTKDLCNLVGGASPGDRVTLKASDGLSKTFPYEYIYTPNPRQGPMVITWYRTDIGYVPSYSDGMRLVMFADTSSNPWGWHVFGNADMRDCWATQYWYNFSGIWPSSGGDSVKYVAKIFVYSTIAPPVQPDILFDGTVSLGSMEKVNVTAYNTGTSYTINATTPLGAMDRAIKTVGLPSNITDKSFATKGVLMVDGIGNYLYNKAAGRTWICQVNGVTLDDYGSPATDGLNLKGLANGDQVNFYYGTKPVTPVNATAVLKIKVNIPAPGPVVDTLFNGTVYLAANSNVSVTAYNTGTTYQVNATTPLGALSNATKIVALPTNITDKSFATKGILMLDGIGNYLYNKSAGLTWICQVNGVTLDDYGSPATDGINLKGLANGDQVNFYYGPKPVTPANATVVLKIKVQIGGTPPAPDWSLSLKGARTDTITKSYFESALACSNSGHMVNYTDADGNNWSGIPLWFLVGIVDDNPDVGPLHYNFNDSIAEQGYSIKVTGNDGYAINFESADIAHSNGYIVANLLNGQPLPEFRINTTKPCYPLQMIGVNISAGKLVGSIKEIELVGLPTPSKGWTLHMDGEITDTISQQYFEQGIVCHHNVTYTDTAGTVWTGVPLWDLVGAVDDIETTSHWTFNDTLATEGYTVRVSAGDGFNTTFASAAIAHNNSYIVANTANGTPLTGSAYPLKLVGPMITSGKQKVGNISRISLEGIPTPFAPGDWNLSLQGAIGAVIPQTEFEYWATCHEATYTDANGNVWTGVPLWRLMGWVDDRIPHGQNGFNDALATAGYKVIVTAGDGYSKEFTSTEIGKTNNFLVANRINGTPLSKEGAHPPYPLRLVGAGVPTSSSVGNIVKIELTDFSTPVAEPQLRVIKYASDQTTILSEVTVNATWMEQNLAVIGDGTTVYKFEAITGNPADVWDANETYPGGYKISNAVKGTKIKDLVELVGGMGSGTDVKLIASDNYETTLPYSSIYTNPAVQTRQGDAILSWWSDGSRVPAYADAYRLYFTPGGDHVYGQWDMHETLPETYWHYYFDAETKYPSCAGLSGKLVRTIKVYSVPAADWTLVLDGRDIGGLSADISKNYFDQALACQFGAEHEASYTDSKGRVWAGIPLWFLAGYVDDADQHSSKSFNDSKALAGYSVVITAKDGYNATVDSRLMIRTSNYIVANSLNGTAFAGTDENFPLRMTGQNITGGLTVKQIASIKLLKSENPFPSGPTLYVPSSVQPPGSSRKGIVQVMNLSQAAGIGVNLQYDPAVMYITDISLNNTLSDASLYTTIDNTTGMVKIAITMTDPVTIPESSGIVDLTFRATGATNATTVLAASRAEWTDATFTNKSFAVVQGNFRVTMKGDFNGNGYVDTGDVSRVAWMVVGRTYELIPDADFNNNGVVDIGDAAKIAWYYVKKIPDL